MINRYCLFVIGYWVYD